jgi:hypothetical protein
VDTSILALPCSLQYANTKKKHLFGISERTFSAETCGAGFARLVIQAFAYQQGLDWVHMWDDRITATCDRSGRWGLGKVSFAYWLSCMESIARGKQVGLSPPCNSPQLENVGIFGATRSRKSLDTKPGWTLSKKHVYAAVCFNAKLSVERGALYPARLLGEDIEFAYVLQSAGLSSLKLHFLQFLKVNGGARGRPDAVLQMEPEIGRGERVGGGVCERKRTG